MKAHQARRQDVDIESAEAKCLVGYLGTIEMPEGPQGRAGRGEELQEIRNCVRRLRVEKKVRCSSPHAHQGDSCRIGTVVILESKL